MFKGTDEAIICRKSFANYGWEGGGFDFGRLND